MTNKTVVTKQDVLDLLKAGEITDQDIRNMMGGSTRVQALADRCVLARIRATRAPTTATNKAERNELAANKKADQHWVSVSNRLFQGQAVQPVTAPYHAVRELLTVGQGAREDGTPANETGVNFGLVKWDDTWTVVPRSRLAELEMQVDAIRGTQEAGKQRVRAEWDGVMNQAQSYLGDMFDLDSFPDAEGWLSKWSIELEVLDFPAFDMRIDMDRVARGDLAMQVRKATMNRIADRMTNAWSRTSEVFVNSVKFAAAVLGNDADTVREMNNTKEERKTARAVPIAQSLLPNLRGQCDLTLALAEAAGDNTLVRFATEVRATIGDIDADTLVKNPDLRATMARNLTNLANQGNGVVEEVHKHVNEAVNELEAFM